MRALLRHADARHPPSGLLAALTPRSPTGDRRHALGAGSDPATLEAFGVPYPARHARLREFVDTVLDLSTGADPVSSVPTPRDRIWLGTGSPEGIAWAVERGLGILSGRRPSGPAGPLPGDREAAEHLARCTRPESPSPVRCAPARRPPRPSG
ncbi:LLM class flavin-dependent oxidoreductase [Embleya sp. NPDC001921]